MTRRRGQIATAMVVTAVAAALLLALAGDRGSENERAATRAFALVVGGDGRAVATIERFDGRRWRARLGRERADGTLDTRFGEALPVEHPAAIARQGDGKLVVAGERVAGGRRLLAVTRVRAGGRIDRGFGRGGVVTIAAGDDDAVARGVATDGRGDIVVAADATAGGRAALAIARVGADGRRRSVELLRDATAAGAATARGGVLVAGTGVSDGRALLARARRGRPVTVSRARSALRGTSWRAVAATADGGAVLVGSGRDRSARSLVAVQRFDPSGRPGAAVTIAAGEGDAYGAAAAAGRDGRLWAGATGVVRDAPTAFVIPLEPRGTGAARPVPVAPGRLAAIASGTRVLTTAWDGARQSAVFVAP